MIELTPEENISQIIQNEVREGEIIVLADGIYRQSLILNKSGTKDKRITIKAKNDGMVVFDGEKNKITFDSRNQKYLFLRGLKFINSSYHNINLDYASFVTMKNCAAYNALGSNCHNFSIYQGQNNYFEGCEAGGIGRVNFNVYEGGNNNLNGCIAKYFKKPESSLPNQGGPSRVFQLYGSSNNLVQNCFATKDATNTSPSVSAFVVWANTDQIANNNKFINCFSHQINSSAHQAADFMINTANKQLHGNRFQNCTGIGNNFGIWWYGDDSAEFIEMKLIGHKTCSVYYGIDSYNPAIKSGAILRNSFLSDTPKYIDNSGWLDRTGRNFLGLEEINNKYI